MKDLPKVYDFKAAESEIYDFRMQGNYFEVKNKPDIKTVSTATTSLGITERLSMGQALDLIIGDIIARYNRMQGFSAIWFPVIDAFGNYLETETEEILKKNEGLPGYDSDRNQFIGCARDMNHLCRDRAVEQLKRSGVSCDRSGRRSAMDEAGAKAVRETFCHLYEKDIIYNKNGIWIIGMAQLAREAIEAVNEGRIRFVPERFAGSYLKRLENVSDRCISKNTRRGHRIPAWYCQDCGHVTVSVMDACCCEVCGSNNTRQDEKVLDSWFSSVLLPLSAVAQPEKDEKLNGRQHDVIAVSGYDNMDRLVAQMAISAMGQGNEGPVKTAFVHGLFREKRTRKIYSSLNYGLDPMELIESFGADALRFSFIIGNSPGSDMRFDTVKCEAMRNFCNKIWNASRFVMMNLSIEKNELPEKLEPEDKWILSKLNDVINEVCVNMDSFELGVAAGRLYNFIWNDYCSRYIEVCKPRLNGSDEEAGKACEKVLLYVLTESLKLLHPFMPFITEKIWQELPHDGESLMTASYPAYSEKLSFREDEKNFEYVMDAIKAVRSRRSELNVPPSEKVRLFIVTDKTEAFSSGIAYFSKLTSAGSVAITDHAPEKADKMAAVITDSARIYMVTDEPADAEKEYSRISKEIVSAGKLLKEQNSKLSNQDFISRAPEKAVKMERDKKEKLEKLITNLELSLKSI